jgi:biopolymer transport protein ExbB/TolQ
MVNEEDFIELNSNFNQKAKCGWNIISLFFIPFIIFLLVVLAYIGIVPLKMEFHSVLLIGIIFLIYLFFIPHNAYFSQCMFKKRYQSLKSELKTYINKNPLTIEGTIKANGSMDDFLKEFTSSLRNDNFSSVAAGVFPTLGILGTFISIAMSMPDFSSQTSDMLEREISLLLGGVGTAFYVSIYGIFLSIWWIFYEKIGMSKFEKDITIIKDAIKSHFWNKIEIEQLYYKKSLESFDKLERVFNTLTSSDIVEDLNKSLEIKLNSFDSLIEKETNVLQGIHQQFELNQNSYEEFAKINQKMMKINLEITKEMQGIIKIVQSLDGNFSNLKEIDPQAIIEANEKIEKNLETMKEDSEKIGWALNQHLNKFDNNITQKLKDSLKLIDEQSVEIVKTLSEIKEIQ